MMGKCLPTALILSAIAPCAVTHAQDPEKGIELSTLQRALDESRTEWVIPLKDRDRAARHYFRRRTLVFHPEAVADQIEAYEMKEREVYSNGPFYVYDGTGKTGADSAWEKWIAEIFRIEPDWASGLDVPYFCSVLKVVDAEGNPLNRDDASPKQVVAASRQSIRSLLTPLVDASNDPAKAKELAKVPMFVVKYVGNFEGNSKFVKLYIGKPSSTEFLVYDVSVYDHY